MRYAPALVGMVLVLSGCGGSDIELYETVQGVVVEVDGDLEKIESFTLRTDGGELIEVVPAPDGDFRFPLTHLHDHRRTLEPILVELDRSVDPASAVTLRDVHTGAWHDGSSDADTTTTSLTPAEPDESGPQRTTPTGAAEQASAPETTPPAEPEPPAGSDSGGAAGTPATTEADTSSSTTTTIETTTTPVQKKEPTSDEVLIELVIVDGSVEGGVRREPVGIGETVTLLVSGNASDEVHVHGYDLYIDLHEGRGRLTFEASIPGIFEVELERSHTPVLQLEVS